LLAARFKKNIDEDNSFSIKLRVYPLLRKENIKHWKNIYTKLLKGVNIDLLHRKRRLILHNLEKKKSSA